jgi:hypothetical protein
VKQSAKGKEDKRTNQRKEKMGNSYTTQCQLSEEEVNTFSQSTTFTPNEVRALWVHFKKMNANNEFMNQK